MTPLDFRGHLQRELSAYAELLARCAAAPALWEAPVAACPGWAVRDVSHHLIELHYWVTDAITGGGGKSTGPSAPPDMGLPEAFATSSSMLLDALDADPATPCWTFADNQTVGFWQRRQPHEHSIHRWDVETAIGGDATLDPTLATDGIDEIITFFWPRQVALGRTEAPAAQVQLRATGEHNGSTWLLGGLDANGHAPVAHLEGTAEDLLLALWKRIPFDHPSLTWSGDLHAGHEIFALKLVP